MMKVIKFSIDDRQGFEDLQLKIHNYLLSNLQRYSADKYADFDQSIIFENENKIALIIDDNPKRYTLILEALTQEEKDSIQEINIT